MKLVAWERARERRETRWWSSRWLVAIVAGGTFAAIVAARSNDATAASHAWLALSLVATAWAFMRVPFHIYWRTDAALLAQLPIGGDELFGAALRRCIRAAAATTLACLVGAVPLVTAMPLGLVAHHAIVAGVLGLAAAALLPAVTTWAAMIVVVTDRHGGGAPALPGSASSVLGALPGFASAVVVVLVVIASPWLVGTDDGDGLAVLGGLAAASVISIGIARASAPRVMGAILRDVSALDRQRLAKLEIDPPTRLERAIGKLLGAAALPYAKDARLMRRRYPMAFALGTLAFVVLAIVGLARPDDPTPWLAAVLGGGVLYAAVLANRLRRPPIELPRLSATLPIDARARTLAKLAWTAAWLVVYLAIPAAFVLARS
jgi:hypothetical protein